VAALVLLVWRSGGEREKGKRAPSLGGKQEDVRSAPSGRGYFGAWMRPWDSLTRTQSSQAQPSSDWELKEVEDAVRKTFLAYNNEDLPAFKAGWTEKGFQQAYERSKEKVKDFGRLSLLSFRPYTLREFSNTEVDGKSAATEVGLTYGEVHETHRFSLVREDDTWKIDQDKKLALFPKDATVVNAKLNFFIIELERTRLTPGTVAFKISNGDTRPHEFIVKKVAASEMEETIGMTKELKPGAQETLILNNLKRGRYVVLCNMVTPDIMPYAYGMRTEFFIE
jgi:hypothetical protein